MNMFRRTRVGGSGAAATTSGRIPAVGCMVALMCGGVANHASAQIRVVSYNIAQLNGTQVDLEDVLVELHDDDSHGFAVPVGIFTFQEVQNADKNALLNMVNNTAPPGISYSLATYTNFGEDGIGGAQAMFYRADLLSEDLSGHDDILNPDVGRDNDRWLLKLKVDDFTFYDSPAASIYIYSCHLKAGSSQSDMDKREEAAIDVRENADLLGGGLNIIYSGDFNLSSSAEQAYLAFFDSGSGTASDPLGAGSWSGGGNAIKHTQSPCTSCVSGLAGGGMDDRFDFQLISQELNDGDGIAIIPGTYRAFGNDGNHFNQAIDAGNNTYFPGDIPRSNALAADLKDASDHIPVVVDYQIPAVLDAAAIGTFGRVIQNATLNVFVLVQNDAPVSVAIGADVLEYTIFGSGDVGGFINDTAAPLAGFSQHFMPVDTSTIGPLAGNTNIIATGEAVHNANVAFAISGDVLRPANPSFDDVSDLNTLLIEDTFDPDTGSQSRVVNIHNFAFDSDQALLDVDSVTGAALPFSIVDGSDAGINSSPGSIEVAIDTAGLAPGLYEAELTLNTSDEDLDGETLHAVMLTWQVTIGGAMPCPWDCTPPGGNGVVNFDDLVAVINAITTQDTDCDVAPDNGDGTFGNGVVNFDDLVDVINHFGACP